MFGGSAAYHRGHWSPVVKARLQKVDHSTIFLAIAGTYTAVALLVLHGWAMWTIIALVWGGTGVGVVLEWLPFHVSRAFTAAVYVVVGWAALAVLPQLLRGLGGVGFSLIAAGGLAYTAGAVVYALKRPDPVPAVYGFHEVFHSCTLLGATLHFVALVVTLTR